jgi:PIN domain nuclease of toxin-antitoxin system
MRLLLDTHLLLWAAGSPAQLALVAHELLGDPQNLPVFSLASLWEIAGKRGLSRRDFRADPRLLRRGLFDNGYDELPITGALDGLPSLHKDPFDQILIAPAIVEGITLLTSPC